LENEYNCDYKSLFENNPDLILSTDLIGKITNVNQAVEKTFTLNKEEVIGTSIYQHIANHDLSRIKQFFKNAVNGKVQTFTMNLPDKKGTFQLYQMKSIPITKNNQITGVYGIGQNITAQKKLENKIFQLAYFDDVTGLPNRTSITDHVIKNIKRSKKFAVLFLDIDRFKMVNDSVGHDGGDQILKDLSGKIQRFLPAQSLLGRFTGDKFAAVIGKKINRTELAQMATNILRDIAKPVVYDNKEFFITASVGICFFPDDGMEEHELLKNADLSLNLAKQRGGNQMSFYSKALNDQALRRMELEGYLRKALHKQEFFLCYQPLLDLTTGKIYGSEALIRWNHPTLGLVSPADFIPLAEETGLIMEIGKWVLHTACKQNKKWHDLGLGDFVISVNVSATQFQQTNFIDIVKGALLESGLKPEYLILELTESVMLWDMQYSMQVMRSLQDMGVKVSIDDFGTGYSSLSYLKNLPINSLKIDRSFIENLEGNSSDIAIVKAIITMGQGLSIKVVAEGVETKEQIELLQSLHCHFAQGYYIHRPLNSNQYEEDLRGMLGS
ncbi:EAL domain-containing protein, partial [Bacillaceae bacterium Marseille-Q3522]|nr:EAL domain-containing protein [Bacillaceae bacterium Marseille-Q3522]